MQGVLFLVLIATVLHILDRQGEFVARTDFIWKAKLKVEQEEVETMRGINKVGFALLVALCRRYACFIIINGMQTRYNAPQTSAQLSQIQQIYTLTHITHTNTHG